MSEPNENDIETERLNIPAEDDDDPRAAAYRIAAWIMEEFEPGFVIIGSPNMGSTGTGYLYPDAVGIIINKDIELTPYGLAMILEELATQLSSNVDEISEFLKENQDGE